MLGHIWGILRHSNLIRLQLCEENIKRKNMFNKKLYFCSQKTKFTSWLFNMNSVEYLLVPFHARRKLTWKLWFIQNFYWERPVYYTHSAACFKRASFANPVTGRFHHLKNPEYELWAKNYESCRNKQRHFFKLYVLVTHICLVFQ